MNTIPVVIDTPQDITPGTLGALTPGSRIKNLDVDKLREAFGQLAGQVSALLQDIKQVGNFQLKEVQLEVEITAEGGVALIGLAKAGAKGAITLKFSV